MASITGLRALSTEVLDEIFYFVDSTSLLYLSGTSKQFLELVRRPVMWNVTDESCRLNRWPWPWTDDDDQRTLSKFIFYRNIDHTVFAGMKSVIWKRSIFGLLLEILRSDIKFVHSIHMLMGVLLSMSTPDQPDTNEQLITPIAYKYFETLDLVNVLGLSPTAFSRSYYAVVASKALVFLKSRLVQHRWNKLLKMNCTGNKLLLEGFLLVAESNSHVVAGGTDCNRRLVKRALSSIAKVVWRHILEQVVSALPPVDQPPQQLTPHRSLADIVVAYIERVTGIALRTAVSSSVNPSREYLTEASISTIKAIIAKLQSIQIHPSIWSYNEVELTVEETNFILELVARLDRTVVLQTITQILFTDAGYNFQGDADTYYDEQNSFIDCVIQRRKGIPITLCALTKLVAAQCGLRGLHFSGMPGHVMLSLVSAVPLIYPLFSPISSHFHFLRLPCDRPCSLLLLPFFCGGLLIVHPVPVPPPCYQHQHHSSQNRYQHQYRRSQ